jgi:hypothetical protein
MDSPVLSIDDSYLVTTMATVLFRARKSLSGRY